MKILLFVAALFVTAPALSTTHDNETPPPASTSEGTGEATKEAAVGCAAGAAVGSVAPGLGTLIGCGVGALIAWLW